MKLNTSVLILTLACGTLWAQNPTDKNPKPAAKTPASAAKAPAPAAKNAPAPAPAAKTVPPKTSAAAPAKTVSPAAAQQKPAPKPVVVPAPKPPVKPPVQQAKTPMKPKVVAPMTAKKVAKPAGEVKPASEKETTRVSSSSGKPRDPFVSPVMRSNGVISSGCDTGKRCLVVDQIVLKGIVKAPSGFIAVVENPAKRAYFMRENDPVFNGKVTKITGDTIVFEEQVLDKLGKQSMREVVKKVNAPVV